MNRKQVDCVMYVMRQAGLEPYIYYYRGGSAYIKFHCKTGGSLRIADHPQKQKYAYAWNLRADIDKFTMKDKGHPCYYYPLDDYEAMVSDMLLCKISLEDQHG